MHFQDGVSIGTTAHVRTLARAANLPDPEHTDVRPFLNGVQNPEQFAHTAILLAWLFIGDHLGDSEATKKNASAVFIENRKALRNSSLWARPA